MVRRIGVNAPQSGITPPEIQDNTANTIGLVQQNVNAGFDAASKANQAVLQAGGAKAAADIEQIRREQQAEQLNAEARGRSSGNGIADMLTGFVGGLTAIEETKQKQARLEMEAQDKALDREIKVGEYGMKLNKERREEMSAILKQQTDVISGRLDILRADLEPQLFQLGINEGVAKLNQALNTTKQEYAETFKQYPELASIWEQQAAKLRSDLYKNSQGRYEKEIKLDSDNRTSIVLNQGQVALAGQMEALRAGAALISPEEAQQTTQNIIGGFISVAEQSPEFMQLVKNNPSVWSNYIKEVMNAVTPVVNDLAKTSAGWQASAARTANINTFIQQLDISDAEQRSVAEQFLRANGVTSSILDIPSSNIANVTIKRKFLDDSQAVAELSGKNGDGTNGLFPVGSEEHRSLTTFRVAELIVDAADGGSIAYAKESLRRKAADAERTKNYGAQDTYLTQLGMIEEFERDREGFVQQKTKLINVERQIAQGVWDNSTPDVMVKNDPFGSGNPERVQVEGTIKRPVKLSPDELNLMQQEALNLTEEMSAVKTRYQVRGLDIERPTNRAYINDLGKRIAPIKQKAEELKLSQGIVVDNTEFIASNPDIGRRSNSPPPTPIRSGSGLPFISGNGEQAVQQIRGNQPLPQRAPFMPQTTAHQLANKQGLGWLPFVSGSDVNVIGASKSGGGLKLVSNKSDVVTLGGGKVLLADKDTVMVQTPEGYTEVFSNLGKFRVRAGDILEAGQVLGNTNKGVLDFELWANSNPVEAYQTGEGAARIDPTKYFKQITPPVKQERSTGLVDVADAKVIKTLGGSIFRGDSWVVSNGMLANLRTGQIRPLNKKEVARFYPNGVQAPRFGVPNDLAQPNFDNTPIAGAVLGTVGSTGRSTGAHLDLRVAERGKRRKLTTEELSYFHIEGKPLSAYKLSSDFGAHESFRKSPHEGMDFAAPDGSTITLAKPVKSISEPWFDKGGGGWVRTVELPSGTKINMLHMNEPERRPNGIVYTPIGTLRPASNTHNIGATSSRMVGSQRGIQSPSNAIDDSRRNTTTTVLAGKIPPSDAALLDTIAWFEGTAGEDGYQASVGHKNAFPNGYTRHPRKVFAANSTATGRYQFLDKSWDIYGGKGTVMTPENQDRVALKYLEKLGALQAARAGNFDEALRLAGQAWASIPTDKASYGQQRASNREAGVAYAQDRMLKLKGKQTQTGTIPPSQRTPDIRTLPTGRVHEVPLAPTQFSAYRSKNPDPSANFGYAELAKNEYLRKTVYSVAIKSGVPQQMVADIYRAKGFQSEADFMDVWKKRTVNPKSLEGLAIVFGFPNSTRSIGSGAGRKYDLKDSSWHTNPRANCSTCQTMSRGGAFVPHKA